MCVLVVEAVHNVAIVNLQSLILIHYTQGSFLASHTYRIVFVVSLAVEPVFENGPRIGRHRAFADNLEDTIRPHTQLCLFICVDGSLELGVSDYLYHMSKS